MIRLDRLLTLHFFRHVSKAPESAKEASIPILMYHSVSVDPQPGISSYYRITTSPSRFREHMHWLHRHKYSVIGLDEALSRLQAQSPNPSPCVVLTFDDGYCDFFTEAWPVLADLGYTATVFLATDFIGHGRIAFKGRACLTWSEVRELSRYGISFGSHTASHPKLYGLQLDEIQRELKESRRIIEDAISSPVYTFAYPYAFPQEDQSFIRRFRHQLMDQGYRAAVSTVIGRARSKSDPLRLERMPINDDDDERFFKAKLAGAYDWMADAQALVRRMKASIHSIRPAYA